MASDNRIEVIIGANASGFRAGAKEAEEHTRSLTSVLQHYRSEMKQEGRFSRFFAADIASMGIASKSAAGEITKLVGAFAIGNSVGLAIESVKMFVEHVNAASEASAKHAEAMKENYKSAAEAVGEALKKVRESFEPAKSQTQTAWEAAVHAQRDKIKEIQKEIDKLVAKGPGVKDFMATLFRSPSEMKGKDLPTESRIKTLQAEQAAILAGIESQRPAKKQTRAEEHEKDLDEMEKSDAQYFASELREWKHHYDQITQRTTEFLQAKFDKEHELAVAEAQLLHDSLMQDRHYYEKETAETTAILHERFQKEAEEAKKLAHEMGRVGKELGDAMGQNLAAVLQGTQSIDDALKNMLGTIIKVAAQMAMVAAMSAGGPLGFLGAVGIGLGGGLLGGLLGGGGGGGGSNHVNVTQNFHGGASPGEHSQAMETMIVNVVRNAQNRGRLT